MNVKAKYYIIPFIFGIFPNLLWAFTALLAYAGYILNFEIMAIPFMMGFYINMLYCLPTGLILYPLGVNIYRNQMNSMISEVTWTGIIANMFVWFSLGLALNLVFRIKLKYENSCAQCGQKLVVDKLRCENCGFSLLKK